MPTNWACEVENGMKEFMYTARHTKQQPEQVGSEPVYPFNVEKCPCCGKKNLSVSAEQPSPHEFCVRQCYDCKTRFKTTNYARHAATVRPDARRLGPIDLIPLVISIVSLAGCVALLMLAR